MSASLLVVSETHLVCAADGRHWSTTGVDGHAFWRRYLDAFDEVVVAARTAAGTPAAGMPAIDGPGVRVLPLPDYRGAVGVVCARRRVAARLAAGTSRAAALCVRAPGPLAALAWRLWGARPFGVEVVGDPLDAFAPGTVRSPARPLARRLLAHQLRGLCRAATQVAYVTRRALQRRYPAAGWSVTYSSIDLDDAAFAADAAVAARVARAAAPAKGTPADPWRLVFVGSLAQLYKGPDVLLDALARLGVATTVVLVGDGAHRPALAARAAALGLGDRVRFAGQLPGAAAVRAELDAADLFVLPSRSEGMPRALLEAMARGLPCAGTRVGGIPELLDDDQMVPPGDADALAGVLARTLAGGPAALDAAARRSRAVAREFHRDVLVPRRQAFYRRLRAECAA